MTGKRAPASSAPESIPTTHASVVLVGEAGVLIRGASGSGKSRLAREIITEARRAGRFAALVADDRAILRAEGGRLVAETPAALAGLLEIRGLGIVTVDFEPAAVIRLVVDCEEEYPPRMREEGDQRVDVHGIVLPRLRLCGSAAKALDVLEFIAVQPAFPVTACDEMMTK
ncbi:HPr kinase/phosphorylase [Chelatococcus sp. GCM10030263]|uniref:HPr kinase/phosphorylase n=1 Tax=Chelatococcus sp. GCM10030263 TaxID=3273387 RepID=UPI00361C4FC2